MPPGVYDKDGFKLGPNGGVFPDPTANLTDPRDFENWDWKQIRAAVVGYAAAPPAAVPTSTPFADPESIRNASVVFNRARAALEYVSENIRLQTEALAGENGAWKSPASEAFRSMNLLFAAKLEAKAQQINGGEFVGTNNVPAQLWNSGNYLQWAQETIQQIDSYYADYVRSVGVTMGDGLARISDYPELVAQMTEDMKKVVRILAQQYVMNTNSVTPPNPSDFNFTPKPPGSGNGPPEIPPPLDGAGGGGNPPPKPEIPQPPGVGGGGGAGGGTVPAPSLNVPPPPGSGGGGPGGGAGGGNRAVVSPPSLDVPSPPDLGGGGPGGGAGGGNRAVVSPPSLDVPSPPDLGGGGGGGAVPPPPSLNVPPPPGMGGGGPGGGTRAVASPPSLNVPPPPDLASGSGGGNLTPPPPLNVTPPTNAAGSGGSGGTSLPTPPPLSVPGPPGSVRGAASGTGGGTTLPTPPSLSVPQPPGGVGGDGTGGGTGSLKPPPALAVNPPSGGDAGTGAGISLPKPPALNVEAPLGMSTGNDRGGAAVPPPMMPPPAGAGGQPGGSAAERPDSSGLLGGITKPWEAGSPPPFSEPGGTTPPVVKPEDWAAGAASGSSAGSGSQVPSPGAPMMPPPAGAGGQPGGSAAERPDSSGLLGGEKKPWEGTKPPAVDLSEAPPPPSLKPEEWAATPGGESAGVTPSGVQAPTEGLNEPLPPAVGLVDSAGTLPAVTQPGQQVPGGMPSMMPPGAGGQPGAGAERPDSSGLLGGVDEPWTGIGDVGKIGSTADVMPPSARPESWAATPADSVPAPAETEPGAPVVQPPVVPPGVGAPATGPERSGSSALLGGDTNTWESVPSPLGTEQLSATPAAPLAPWAVPPGEEVVILPEMPAEGFPAPEDVVSPAATAAFAEPAEDVDLTPAAAPAGWAESSSVVPAAQEGPSAAATAAVLGASAVTAAAAFGPIAPQSPGAPATSVTARGGVPAGPSPSGTGPSPSGSGSAAPHHTEFPHVDDEGDVEDDRDEDRAGGGLVLQGGGAGPMPGVDSVVVVRPDDAAQDTSAWDAGGADFLLPGTFMPVVVAKSDRSGWDGEQQAPDITLKSAEPWESEPAIAHATYRRRKAGEPPTVVDSFVAPPSCGDEYSIPADEREAYLAAEAERAAQAERQDEEEDEDTEPEERSAADLLNESGSAWGASKVSQPTGVLE
jgi:hypothetical protein